MRSEHEPRALVGNFALRHPSGASPERSARSASPVGQTVQGGGSAALSSGSAGLPQCVTARESPESSRRRAPVRQVHLTCSSAP